MTDWLGSVKDIVSLVADSKAILSVGVGGLALISGSVAGVIPRVGPVRALSLGFKSYFKTTYPLSVRKSDINQLSDSLLWMEKGEYITVTGGKGIGKSCLIDTTLNRQFGVVKISVSCFLYSIFVYVNVKLNMLFFVQTKSGADKDIIIDLALRALTGIQIDFLKPVGSARRLLFFYSFLFKRSPIVVIRVPERERGEQYPQVTSAVRDLTDLYGLRVVVDGSPNSLPPTLIATKREVVVAIEPMSKEQIDYIPEYKDLIDFLKSHNLDEPVWKVLGGSPIEYLKLKKLFVKMLSRPDTVSDEVVNQVKNHIKSVLSKALTKNVADSSPNTKQIIKLFRERKVVKIPKMELEAMGFLLDYPNKVLREVDTGDDSYIVLQLFP